MKANDFEARALEAHEYRLWNELTVQSLQGTIFHNIDYLQTDAKVSSSKLKIYGCFKNDELVGGCSLFAKRFGGVIPHAVSTGPLTPFGGFLLPDLNNAKMRQRELVQNGILNALCDCIQRERYSSISIVNSPDLLDVRPCLWRGWEGRVAYTYYINIESNFFERFSKSVQREVKKADNAGFYIERLDDAAVHHKLFTQVFERQNRDTPVRENLFTSILDVTERKKCGGMWVARDESDNVLASRIWLWDNKRAYAWSAASNQAFRSSGANQFLFVRLLEEMQKKGIRQVNIMQGNTRHLSYHATGYNPILVSYYSVKKNGFMSSMASGIKKAMKNHR